MFYSPSLKGFCHEEILGPRKIVVTSQDEDGVFTHTEIDNPDCKIPADAVEITVEECDSLLYAETQGKVISFDVETQKPIAIDRVFTPEEIIAQYTAKIQARLDDFARTRGYDSCLSACTYATSQVTKFAAEGQYMVNARDATWATAYEIMADVQAGTRPMPTIEDLIAELGALTWPA